MSSIEKQIQAFVAGSASEYAFPGLSVEERKLVKNTAEKFGLSSRSFGMGSERQIHIFKPASPTTTTFEPVKYSVKNTFVDGPVDVSTPVTEPPQAGPAHNSMPVGALKEHIAAEEQTFAATVLSKVDDSPRTSVDTSSTKDSDSDSQDPQISIKNSFVHFEVDSKETADPRIVQSMPAGTFVEHLEAERAANVASKKGRPMPLCEALETEIIPASSAMLFPSTPNADNQMSFAGHGEGGVPVVQWVSGTTPSSESITVLPPAQWASAPYFVESSAVPMPTGHGPSPEMLQGSAPPLPQQGATTGRLMPESVTVLPPAFWAPQPVPAAQTSPQGPPPPPQTSPHGLPPQPLPQLPVPPGPPTVAVPKESVTVLPPAFWAPAAPAASRVENDSSSAAVQASQGSSLSQGPQQGLQQESTPPMPPSGPAQPQFMPGTHVVLQGLANQPDFNGLCGTVSAFDGSCDRYNIVIESGPNAQRRMVKVKFQNLLLAQPPCATGPGPAPQQAVMTLPPGKASLVLDQMV